MNLFRETEDIPVIKPRTLTNSKNEFNVVLQRAAADFQADLSLFPRVIKEQAESEGSNPLGQLRAQLQKLKDDLAKEERLLKDLQDEHYRKKDARRSRSSERRDRRRSPERRDRKLSPPSQQPQRKDRERSRERRHEDERRRAPDDRNERRERRESPQTKRRERSP